MIISANRISHTLKDTEMMEKIGVSVPDARDGGISRIKPGAAMDCTVQNEAGKNNIVYTEAEAKQLHTDGGGKFDDSQMSPADFISRCMTGEDAKALSDEETPLEEYTSSQLERAVTRIKGERRDKQEAVEHQVARQREKAEVIEQSAVEAAASDQMSELILEQLMASSLPVTPENVVRLSHAIDMASEIGSFSEASMKFFIGSEFAVTPENISASHFGAAGAAERQPENGAEKTEAVTSDDFSLLENQVQELLAKDGVVPDEKSMETARWLYENDLPVTPEQIRTYGQLEELKELEPEVVSARIADQMAEGVRPEKANLMKISVAEAITAKRRLEETRLEMTVDALRNMAAKGIDLDITNLENIVKELRQQEEQARQSLLEETGLPVTEENAHVMGDTLQAAKTVLGAPVEFLGQALESPDADTLAGLSEQAKTFTAEYSRVEQSYEAVGTEVRRDLGDSITKAFGNVDDILTDLGLEAGAANQRAVRALAYNQMPLTEENILRMKEYDSRVTTLMQDMKPHVVAELIRREINPLDISLEELSEQVEEIQSEIGADDLSFSKYLWKMDHQKAITPEERESMIGVYRLLDKIEKSDGAAAGQLLKEGRELSLSALLSALRTRRDAGINVQVDDEFGGLKETVASGTTISEQIQAAYQKTMAGELKKDLSPEVLHRCLEEGSDLTMEQLLERSRAEAAEGTAAAEEAAYYEEMANELRMAMEGSEKQILDFLAALDLPDTVANLQAMQEYSQPGSKEWHKMWKSEESEAVLESFDDPERLDSVMAEIEENHQRELAETEQSDDINYESLHFRNLMTHTVSLFGRMRDYQMYEIPVFTEQGITTCNVTIRDGADVEKGSVEITMESAEFGRMQATFKVKGTHVNGFVSVEQETAVSLCRQRMEHFEKELGENGFTMDGGSPVKGSRNSLHVGNRAEGTKNQDLYRIAKMFVVSMNRKDDVE